MSHIECNSSMWAWLFLQQQGLKAFMQTRILDLLFLIFSAWAWRERLKRLPYPRAQIIESNIKAAGSLHCNLHGSINGSMNY
jgi:hypothetical protein